MLDPDRVSGPGTIASLVEVLETSRATFGARPLFVTKAPGGTKGPGGWVETTYEEFASLVDQLRAGLGALGVGRGDRVGIISGNRVEWAVATYASYGLGAALVPMYESQLEKDWSYIARDSGLKVLFVSSPAVHAKIEALASSLPALEHVVSLSDDGPAPTYRALLGAGAASHTPALRPRSDETAALLYTSGTTGEPKGVILTHGNVVSNALSLRDLILASEDPAGHRSLSFLPWAHAFGQTAELHMLISAGASMGIAENVDTVVDDIKEVKPTVLFAVPRVFNRIYAGVQKLVALEPPPVRWLIRRGLAAAKARASGRPVGLIGGLAFRIADRLVFARVRARFGGRLRFAISGAASLAREVAEFIDAIGISVYEGYGLTEASPIVTANVPGRRKLGSAGQALPGVRVVIERSATQDARQGELAEIGEIVVYGPNVMRGYHGRDDDTRAVFTADGGLRTGDLGHLDAEGYLFITGRIKEQYKLENGKYVVPALLEERLKVSPAIANVMVYGDNKPYNVALVVPAADTLAAHASKAAVRERIESEIDRLSVDFKGYERVRAIVIAAEDFTQHNEMLTPSLKLRRHNILRRWRDQLDELYRVDPPR